MGGRQVRSGAAAAEAAAAAAVAAGLDTVDTVAQREGDVAGTGSVAAQKPVALQSVVFVRQIKVGRGELKAARAVSRALEAVGDPSRRDWRIAGAGIDADFEQRLVSGSSGSTWTVGAGPDTDDCHQAYLQGESAAVWSVDLGSMQQEGLGFEWEQERVGSCP